TFNGQSKSASLTVNPELALTAVTTSPAAGGGGSPVAGLATFNKVASGAVVTISLSPPDPALAELGAAGRGQASRTGTVPQGSDSAAFTLVPHSTDFDAP